jgi:hypothetical protein
MGRSLLLRLRARVLDGLDAPFLFPRNRLLRALVGLLLRVAQRLVVLQVDVRHLRVGLVLGHLQRSRHRLRALPLHISHHALALGHGPILGVLQSLLVRALDLRQLCIRLLFGFEPRRLHRRDTLALKTLHRIIRFRGDFCLHPPHCLRVPTTNLIDVCVRLGLHLVLGRADRRKLRFVLFIDRPCVFRKQFCRRLVLLANQLGVARLHRPQP